MQILPEMERVLPNSAEISFIFVSSQSKGIFFMKTFVNCFARSPYSLIRSLRDLVISKKKQKKVLVKFYLNNCIIAVDKEPSNTHLNLIEIFLQCCTFLTTLVTATNIFQDRYFNFHCWSSKKWTTVWLIRHGVSGTYRGHPPHKPGVIDPFFLIFW